MRLIIDAVLRVAGHGPGIPDGQFHNYNKSYHDHGQETADTVLLNRFEFPPN